MRIVGLMKTTLLDYPGKVASTLFTGGCNFRCPYCHNGDLVLKHSDMDTYSHEEIFAHLTKRQKTLDGVCITGGEPTLQKDLPNLISEIKDLGLLVKLDTNGTNPTMLKELLDKKLVDYVAMDIKHSRPRYNEVACMQNFNISPIEESVELLKNSDIDYEFRTTVARELHDKEDFKDIGKWINGAKAYYLQPYKESEQVISKGYSTYSASEFEEIVAILRGFDIGNVDVRALD
ncbi:MAG: anaerobic ribonucleoside-triphosphate reductase activating protein [Lachnospiraceae bacterium]|nr:anaerobic ribonucleoside-triphosphate reductase activating protein [Lachnospiraceae bacterium]